MPRIRFSPCSCCDEVCDPLATDDFDRQDLGPDWVVLSGSWSISNNALTGQGEVVYVPEYDPGVPFSGGIMAEFQLVSGTADVGMYQSPILPNQPTVVRMGDGNCTWIDSFQTKQVPAPSTGNVRICPQSGKINVNSFFSNLSVKIEDFWDTEFPNYYGGLGNWNPPYTQLGFKSTSQIQIKTVKIYDQPCCSQCPGCRDKQAKLSGVIMDFGEESIVCNGVTLTGEYLLSGDPQNDICGHRLTVQEGSNTVPLQVVFGGDGTAALTADSLRTANIQQNTLPIGLGAYVGPYAVNCEDFEIEATIVAAGSCDPPYPTTVTIRSA